MNVLLLQNDLKKLLTLGFVSIVKNIIIKKGKLDYELFNMMGWSLLMMLKEQLLDWNITTCNSIEKAGKNYADYRAS